MKGSIIILRHFDMKITELNIKMCLASFLLVSKLFYTCPHRLLYHKKKYKSICGERFMNLIILIFKV